MKVNIGNFQDKFRNLSICCISFYCISIALFLLVPSKVLAQEVNISDDQKGPVVTDLLWKDRIIPVCWMNPSADPDGKHRDVIRNSINSSWGRFIGREIKWNPQCRAISEVTEPEIRIFLDLGSNVRPASSVGTRNWGLKNGKWTYQEESRHADMPELSPEMQTWSMYLNSQYYNDPWPRRLRFLAMHEFGHALGFLHTQTTDGTPADCISESIARGGRADERVINIGQYGQFGIEYTRYDSDSIMNYCRPDLTLDRLSEGDKALASAYYPKSSSAPFGNSGNYSLIGDPDLKRCLSIFPDGVVKMANCNLKDEFQAWEVVTNDDFTVSFIPKTEPHLTLTISEEGIEGLRSGELIRNYQETQVKIASDSESASRWYLAPIQQKNVNKLNSDEKLFLIQMSLGGLYLDRDTYDPAVEKVIIYKNVEKQNQNWRVSRIRSN